MRGKRLLLPGIIVAAIVLYASCRRMDYTNNKEEKVQEIMELKFFSQHKSEDPGVQAISSLMKRENGKYNFLESITGTVGYPYWDKTVFIKKPSALGRGSTADSSDYYYIPFVRDSQEFVNASLIVKVNAADTSVRWLNEWQYDDYGFDTTDVSAPNAKKAFLTFANLEISVFGHHNFLINDGRILGYADTQKLRVSVDPPSNRSSGVYGRGADEVYYNCQRVSVCVVAGVTQTARGMNDPYTSGGCGGSLYSALYCNVFMFYGGSGGNNSGWTNVGSGYVPDPGAAGGSGTPGGGYYFEGWSPPPNPCNTSARGASIQDCTSVWEVIEDELPLSTDPIDSMLAKYSRAMNTVTDSIFMLSMNNNEEWGHILVKGAGGSIYPKNCTTAHNPAYVRQNRSIVPGETIIAEVHIHPDTSSNPLERDGPSADDLWGLKSNTRERYTLFVDCGDQRFALVIENVDSARVFLNTHSLEYFRTSHDSISVTITNPSWVNDWRNATKQSMIQILGSSSTSGIGFYISSNAEKSTYIKLNP